MDWSRSKMMNGIELRNRERAKSRDPRPAPAMRIGLRLVDMLLVAGSDESDSSGNSVFNVERVVIDYSASSDAVRPRSLVSRAPPPHRDND